MGSQRLLFLLLLLAFHTASVAHAQQDTACVVLTTPHKGVLLQSWCQRQASLYTVVNTASVTDRRLEAVHVEWLSALLTTGKDFLVSPDSPMSLEYTFQSFGAPPVVFDAADIWSIDHSVKATTRFGEERFDAPAYAPLSRNITYAVQKFPASLISKILGLLKFTAAVTDTGEEFTYVFEVQNLSDETLWVNWTSLMAEEFRVTNGWFGRLEPSERRVVYEASGPGWPVQIIDVARFGRERMEVQDLVHLGNETDLTLRVLEVHRLGDALAPGMALVPAFADASWLRSAGQ